MANAFVARWCAGCKVETVGGMFRVRTDAPSERAGAALHRHAIRPLVSHAIMLLEFSDAGRCWLIVWWPT